MDAPAGALPAMRSPDRWLAGLRIAVGVWFAKAIFTKLSVTLAWGFLPVPTASDRWQHIMPVLVTKYAEGNPIGFFREFLLRSEERRVRKECRSLCDWSSDVCSSDLARPTAGWRACGSPWACGSRRRSSPS